MADETEMEDLRLKVKSLESELNKLHSLRSVSKRVIGDYDDLYGKYRDAKKTNDDLLRKFDEQEVKFEQVVQVLQGAANDFAAMESKVHLGEYLQSKAERFATEMYEENRKINVENKKIKRQSQKLMAVLGESTATVTFDIDIDGDVTETDSSLDTAQIESLSDTISQLRKTIETLEVNLNNAQIERQTSLHKADEYKVKYEEEKQKLKEANSTIGMYESMKENFARVSAIAAQRIEFLEKGIEFEKSLTNEAVKKASHLHSKHQALKRQSLAFMQSSSNDVSLHKALEQIHKLTLEMETQRLDHEEKLGALSAEKLSEELENLQKEIDALQKENDTVSKQNGELFHKLETANYDNRVLREQVDMAKRGPPPPPPPPPPPIKVLNPIKWIMGKKNPAGKGPKKPEGAENFDKALAELMERIKNKSSAEPSPGLQQLINNDTNQTSKQLNDFIGALKKTDFKPVAKPEREPEPEPEFMRVRRKMSQPKNEIGGDEAVELRR